MQAIRGNVFDGTNIAVGSSLHGDDARADALAILMHRAGTAQRHAAGELGPGQTEHVAQVPEQRHIGFAVEGVLYTIDFEIDHIDVRNECVFTVVAF
jgi:hypothetical protein